jgi:hypothetical protein
MLELHKYLDADLTTMGPTDVVRCSAVPDTEAPRVRHTEVTATAAPSNRWQFSISVGAFPITGSERRRGHGEFHLTGSPAAACLWTMTDSRLGRIGRLAMGEVAVTPDTRGMLLERKSALASLLDYAREARRGDGRLVLVAGEEGVGKSALVEPLQPRWPTHVSGR